jgi:anti-sigma regulatory factor (Ser/Thr protein kinase)
MSTSDPTHAEPVRPAAGSVLALDQVFDLTGLIALRSAIAAHAAELGLTGRQRDELILMAHELASNAITHGGGRGRLRLWATGDRIRCEISDSGPGLPAGLAAGRQQPPLDAIGGRGLWLVRTFADEVELRSGAEGTTVTVTVRTEPS